MKIAHWKRDARSRARPLLKITGVRTPTFEKEISDPFFCYYLFWFFLSEIMSSRCRLSRTTSNFAQKVINFRPNLRFSYFSGEKFGKILSRRSRLSRTSRAPSRLIRLVPDRLRCRARPSDEDFPGFGQLPFWTAPKKNHFRAQHLVLIYTPKEARSRIFVTRGSFFARQMLATKTDFLGAASL